ncbi:MAG TPA: lysophospholipid acyltransferase family protein, partial [Thermodesulfobacteriota bacterium]|nr:lysophospholipid acyltransferase family protein [Thermodesulfobacteriota bacterium]
RLLMMPFLPKRGRVGMMVSRHRDGEFIARAVKLFGIDSLRGSTTQGGTAALRAMIRFYRDGANLAITPDGPQGPRHVVQPGVIELARQTGGPILPVTYSASRKKVFASWDRFILPYPFSRVVFIWGEPLLVPRETDRTSLEEIRLILEERLKRITEEADRMFER